MRYFVELAYRGTNFNGFQIQPNGITVEGELEKALSIVLRQPIDVTGSSRTDTGVHALQQFVHFEVDFQVVELVQLKYRLNKMLGKDIQTKAIFEVAQDKHARFDAVSRKYEYRIIQEKDIFLQSLAYFYHGKTDIDKMNEAAKLLLVHADFQCFSKVNTEVNHFECTIEEAYWQQRQNQLIFTIKANRFLRGMVRAVVGTLLEVGEGKISLTDFQAVLDSKNRSKAGRAVPPEGLFLVEVNY